jgi:hypothetical protein
MPLLLAFASYPMYRFEEVTSQRARPTLTLSAILPMRRARIARHSGSPAQPAFISRDAISCGANESCLGRFFEWQRFGRAEFLK